MPKTKNNDYIETIAKQFNAHFAELINSGYSEQELAILMKEAAIEQMKPLIKDIDMFENIITPYTEISFVRELSLRDNKEEIINNSIIEHLSDELDNYLIIKNHLLELSIFDKVIDRNEKKYFFLIDLLLKSYKLHLESLEERTELYMKNDVEEGGVILSTSNSPKKIIASSKNAVIRLKNLCLKT